MISELILQEAARAEQDRQTRIRDAWNAYYGNFPKPLKATKSDPYGEDNVILNYASLIVDFGVGALFGKELEFQVDGKENSDSGEDTPQDEWLDGFWRQNQKDISLLKIGVNGGVAGHTFVRLLPPPAGKEYPRIVVLDPGNVWAFYSTDDCEDVWCWKIQWSAIDYTGRTPVPVVRRQLIQRNEQATAWTIRDQVSRAENPIWTDVAAPIAWPYEWSPIHQCQNLPAPNVFWGQADLSPDVLAPNRSMNFIVSNAARIVRHHAHPKTWGKGFNAKTLDTSVDEIIALPSDQASLQNLEMQSDLSSSIELYKRQKEALHEISRIPEVATGKVDSSGALSGVALQILYHPLIEKTETKRRLYGPMLESLCEHAMEFGGAGTHQVSIQWPPLLPKDDQAEVQGAILLDQLGVSKKTLLSELGYDAEEEAKQKDEERKAAAELGSQMMDQFSRGQLPDQGQMPPRRTPIGNQSNGGTAMMNRG